MATATFAQEVGMRPGGPNAVAPAAVVSPVVNEGKVTFRLRALMPGLSACRAISAPMPC